MREIFENNEFIELEQEEKKRVLELLISEYDENDLNSSVEGLKIEKLKLETKLSENKEKLLNFSFDAKYNDDSVISEIEEMKKQATTFKQKAVDLEKHKYALEIKNSLSRKDALKREVEDLKTELESLRTQKIDSQNTLVEIRANFENFYNSYNDEVARLKFEEQKFYSLANDNSRNEENILDGFKTQEKLKELEDNSRVLKEKIHTLKIKCEAVEKDIEERKEELLVVDIPENSKELIVQAKDLESEIIIYDEMISRLDKLIDETKQDLKFAKEGYSAQLSKERKIDEDLSKIESSTAKVFENSELTNFEKLRSCDKSLADMTIVEYELSLVDKQIEKLKFRINERNLAIEKFEKQSINAEELLVGKRQVLKDLNQELKKTMETREEMLGSNSLGLLTKYTNLGDSCPICKAKVYEKNYVEVMDLTPIDREIEMAKTKVSFAEKDKDMALSGTIALKAKIDFLTEQNDHDSIEINNLETSKTKIYQKIIDINDKTPENFIALKNAVKKTSNALEDLIKLQSSLKEDIDQNNTKKVEYGTKISMLTEQEESLIDLYYVLQKERAEREILMLEAKFAVSGDKFEEKRVEFAEYEVDKNRLLDEIMQLYSQLSELKTQIFVLQEELADVEYQHGKLEANNIDSSTMSQGFSQSMTIDEINSKQNELKETYKHLLSLKDNAENSFNSVVRDYELKTELLKYNVDELQDVSALVSSLLFRYGFDGEEEVKLYIITDNMLKLKENELKSYNNRLAKLEAIQEQLTGNNSTESEQFSALNKENEDIKFNLGEINIKLQYAQEKLEDYKILKQKLKQYN